MSALMNTYARADIQIARGEGVHLFDTEGRAYLDLAGGIAVNCLGHGHPALVRALKEQADRVWHVSNLYRIPDQERLAERLAELTFADKVFFCNSGAEAVEGALKVARKFHQKAGTPERYRFITFKNAFHGRTLATCSSTDQEKIRDGFEPLLDWFDTVALNDLDAVKAAIGDRTAGILLEPIQGEGGLAEAKDDFLRALRALCDERGLLLIYDEVQTGVGRTGDLFAYEQSGVAPDIMAVAKGLGGGFPIGAVLASDRAASGMAPGAHGSTFGGNPLACAVALAVLGEVSAPGFLDRVRDVGARFKDRLAGLAGRFPDLFVEARGRGFMLGLKTRVPSRDFVNHARQFGIFTAAAGDNVVRMLPPLILAPEHIDMAEDGLARAADAWLHTA